MPQKKQDKQDKQPTGGYVVRCKSCNRKYEIFTSGGGIRLRCICGMTTVIRIPPAARYKKGTLPEDPTYIELTEPNEVKEPQVPPINPPKEPPKERFRFRDEPVETNTNTNTNANTWRNYSTDMPPAGPPEAFFQLSRGCAPKILAYLRSNYTELLQSFSQETNEEVLVYSVLQRTFSEYRKDKYVLSNFIYEDEKGTKINRVLIRTTQNAFLRVLYGADARMLLQGHIGTKSIFYIEKIEIVHRSEDLTANEKLVEMQVHYRAPLIQENSQYIWSVLDHTPQYTDSMRTELAHWEEYLDWQQKLTALKISGTKYIGFYVSTDRRLVPNGVVFLCVSPDNGTFQSICRTFEKDHSLLSVYSNMVSRDRWVFTNDLSSGYRYEQGPLLALREIHAGLDASNNWDEYAVFAKSYRVDQNRYTWQLAKSRIENNRRDYPRPVWFEMHFDLPEDTESYLQKRHVIGATACDRVAEDVFKHIFTDGFIATSRIGDFALNARLKHGLLELKSGQAVSGNLGNWIFDISRARANTPLKKQEITWSDWGASHLNDAQKTIISRILNIEDVFLCQGPPGTGKTTVIAEAVYQLTQRGKRVIIASQTNLAVNNALSKLLIHPSIRAIRLGAESKLDESVEAITDRNILQTFFTGVREHVQKTFLDPWTELTRGSDQLQQDLYQAKEIQANILALEKGVEEAQRVYKRSGDQAQKLDTKYDPGYIQFQIDNLTHMSKCLRARCLPLPEVGMDRVLSVRLINQMKTPMAKLLEGGYAVYPNHSETLKVVELDRQELAALLNLWLTLCVMSTPIRRSFRDLTALQAEREEVLAHYDFHYPTFLHLEFLDKSMQTIGASSALRETPAIFERLREILPPDIRDKDMTTIRRDVVRNIGDASPVLDKVAAEIDQAVATLQQFAADNEKALGELHQRRQKALEDISASTPKIQELMRRREALAQKYGVVDTTVLSHLEDAVAIQEQKIDVAVKREDFEPFLKEFVAYIDEIGEDYSLENEIYLPYFINACNVVGVSCTESSYTLTEKGFTTFDVAIVDEVSKATPPEILLPLLLAERAVLVGDHRQLPPLFGEHYNSYQEYREELDPDDLEGKRLLTDENYHRFEDLVTNSLFKRHYERAHPRIKGALLQQYRMHREIMDVVNIFYDGKLTAGYTAKEEQSAKAHSAYVRDARYKTMVNMAITPDHHAYWVDTTAFRGTAGYEETRGTSKCNRLEALVIAEILEQIEGAYTRAKIDRVEVGVISFYSEQVRLIRDTVRERCHLNVVQEDINSVDRFQGREREIVIVSLVRNVRPGVRYDASFVKDYRRINVAMSRAQKLLIIVGASAMYREQKIVIEDMETGAALPARQVYGEIMELLVQRRCFLPAEAILKDANLIPS